MLRFLTRRWPRPALAAPWKNPNGISPRRKSSEPTTTTTTTNETVTEAQMEDAVKAAEKSLRKLERTLAFPYKVGRERGSYEYVQSQKSFVET